MDLASMVKQYDLNPPEKSTAKGHDLNTMEKSKTPT